MSINDMMSSCGLKTLKKFGKNYVSPALEEEAIERKYPDNPHHPQQRYRFDGESQDMEESSVKI